MVHRLMIGELGAIRNPFPFPGEPEWERFYGLRLSRPGKDVRTSSGEDLIFNSNATNGLIIMQGAFVLGASQTYPALTRIVSWPSLGFFPLVFIGGLEPRTVNGQTFTSFRDGIAPSTNVNHTLRVDFTGISIMLPTAYGSALTVRYAVTNIAMS